MTDTRPPGAAEMEALIREYGFSPGVCRRPVRGTRRQCEVEIEVRGPRDRSLTAFKPGPDGYDLAAAIPILESHREFIRNRDS